MDREIRKFSRCCAEFNEYTPSRNADEKTAELGDNDGVAARLTLLVEDYTNTLQERCRSTLWIQRSGVMTLSRLVFVVVEVC